MGIFFGWIIFSFLIGILCADRKIGFWGAFFLSLLLSPIIGLIFTLVSSTNASILKEEVLKKQAEEQTKAIQSISAGSSYVDDLFKLKSLYDSKLITLEEFEKEKALLDQKRTDN